MFEEAGDLGTWGTMGSIDLSGLLYFHSLTIMLGKPFLIKSFFSLYLDIYVNASLSHVTIFLFFLSSDGNNRQQFKIFSSINLLAKQA